MFTRPAKAYDEKKDDGQKYAEIFRFALENHIKNSETGRWWQPSDFELVTNGYLTQYYIVDLYAGNIRNPGMDKLQKISELMGFPFDYWVTPIEKLRG